MLLPTAHLALPVSVFHLTNGGTRDSTALQVPLLASPSKATTVTQHPSPSLS